MTKVKLKEATKELNQKAGTILEESAGIRRSAEQLLGQLQRQRIQMLLPSGRPVLTLLQ